MFGWSGSMMSRMRTMAVTESVPSLMLPSPAVCEWQSMMPGVTHLPVASMTLAFGSRALTFGPTSTILPSRIRIEPFLIVPCEAVMMVAFCTSSSREAGADLAARAPLCANAEPTIVNVSRIAIIAFSFFIAYPSAILDFRFWILDYRLTDVSLLLNHAIQNLKSKIQNRFTLVLCR